MMSWNEVELTRLRREERYREAAEERRAATARGTQREDGLELALRFASALFALGLILMAMLA